MHRFTRINNNKKQEEKRQDLRSNLTPAELVLWRFLKNQQFHGKIFRRQFSIGSYILDFYCHEEKLAIELDGADHFTLEGMAHDKKRDAYLNRQGVRVIRIENKKVFQNTGQVLDHIQSHFLKK